MPLVPTTRKSGPLQTPVQLIQPTPVNERGIWRSAFDTENFFDNFGEILDQNAFQEDPNFDLIEYSKGDPLFGSFTDQFLGVQSKAEYDYVRRVIQHELFSRQRLEQAGIAGFAAEFISAVLSPTSLIPLGSIGIGLKMGQAALRLGAAGTATGAAAMAIDESVLQASPNVRSGTESLANIAFGTALSGALGAGIGSLAARGVDVRIPRLNDDAVVIGREPPSAVPESTVSAARSPEDVDERTFEHEAGTRGRISIEDPFWLTTATRWISPLLRAGGSRFNSARDMARRISSGGLPWRTEDGKFVGGVDVETLAKMAQGMRYAFISQRDAAYKEYKRQGGKMKFKDINEAAVKAIDDAAAGREVEAEGVVLQFVEAFQATTKRIREQAEAQGFPEIVHWIDSEKYRPYILHTGFARVHLQPLTEVIAEHLEEVITVRVTEAYKSARERFHQVGQEIEALQAGREALAREMEVLAGERKALEQNLSPEATELRAQADELKAEMQGLRKTIKETEEKLSKMEPEQRLTPEARRQQQIADLAKRSLVQRRESLRNLFRGSEELRHFQKALSGIRRRGQRLRDSIGAREAAVEKKIAEIDRAEELQLEEMNRLITAGGRLLEKVRREREKFAQATLEQRQEKLGEIAKMRARQEQLREEIAVMDKGLEQAEGAAAEAIQKERARRLKQISNLEGQIKRAMPPEMQAVQRLQEQADELDKKISKINEQLKKFTEEEAELAGLGQRIERLEGEREALAEAEAEYDKLAVTSDEIETAKKKQKELIAEAEELVEKADELKGARETTERAEEESSRTLLSEEDDSRLAEEQLRDDIADAEEILKNSEEDLKRYQEDLAEAIDKDEKAEIREQIRDTKDDLKEAKKDLERFKKQKTQKPATRRKPQIKTLIDSFIRHAVDLFNLPEQKFHQRRIAGIERELNHELKTQADVDFAIAELERANDVGVSIGRLQRVSLGEEEISALRSFLSHKKSLLNEKAASSEAQEDSLRQQAELKFAEAENIDIRQMEAGRKEELKAGLLQQKEELTKAIAAAKRRQKALIKRAEKRQGDKPTVTASEARANITDIEDHMKQIREELEQTTDGGIAQELEARLEELALEKKAYEEQPTANTPSLEEQLLSQKKQLQKESNNLRKKAQREEKKLLTKGDTANIPFPVTTKELNDFMSEVRTAIQSIDEFVQKWPDYAALARESTGSVTPAEVIQNLSDRGLNPEFRSAAQIRKERGQARSAIGREKRKGKKGDKARIKELGEQEKRLTEELERLENDLRVLDQGVAAVLPSGGKVIDGVAEPFNTLRLALLELGQKRLGTLNRRALRIKKMQEQRAKLDPQKVQGKVDDLTAVRDAIEKKFFDTLDKLGVHGDRSFLDEGDIVFNVKDVARRKAINIANKMSGNRTRVVTAGDLGLRGSELERTLNIDPQKVWSNGWKMADFLENDISVLQQAYLNTLGPDLAVHRMFGSVTAFGTGTDGGTNRYAKLFHEEVQQHREEAMKIEDPKKRGRELRRIANAERRDRRDITEMVNRIRRLRDLALDPYSIPRRLGKFVMNLNVNRLMGAVSPASIPDLANQLSKLGIASVFRDGLGTLILNTRAFSAINEHNKLRAVGNDIITSARLKALSDVTDDNLYGNVVERGMQAATNYFGIIAMFDYWNAAMKQFVGVTATLRMVHAISRVAQGRANRLDQLFLAQAFIDDDMVGRMWRELTNTPNGSTMYKGVMVPNTEEWIDKGAAEAFDAGILRLTDDTIVTPGVERPLMMDDHIFGKMIFQFQSFTYSSLVKTTLHRAMMLRAGDINTVVSIAAAIALGIFSYQFRATMMGGDQYDKMRKADFDTWLQEGILRSGLLGPMATVWDGLGKVAYLNDYVNIGDPTVKQFSQTRNPLLDPLGPTLGLLNNLWHLGGTLDNPKEMTYKSAIRLAPYHTLWWLRGFITMAKGEWE